MSRLYTLPVPFSESVSRRAALGLLGAAALAGPARAMDRIEVIAFDGFPIFDPRSVVALVRRRVPDQGEALAREWAAKLFGYTWLVTAAGRYRSFDLLADAALRDAAAGLAVDMPDALCAELVGAYSRMAAWPDVKAALDKLKIAGVRLVFLSNLSEVMLRANIASAGLEGYFDLLLSTDRVQKFKPAPEAYQMAMEALRLPKTAIGFAAFGGWDATGATWFGYKTAWINRLGFPADHLVAPPAIVSRDMSGALSLAGLA